MTREELGQIVTQRYQELLAYARKLTRDRDVAQDVVQETIARVYDNTHYLTAKQGFGWLSRCLKYTWLRRLQQERRRGRHYGEMGDRETRGSEEPMGAGVEAYLQLLPPVDRTIVLERVVRQTSIKDTARLVGLSTQVVEKRKQRALAKLRGKLAGLRREGLV